MKEISKVKFVGFILTPILIFIGSFITLALLFQQNDGVLWQSLLASALYSAALSYFVLLCMLNKLFILLWLAGTLVVTTIVYFNGTQAFTELLKTTALGFMILTDSITATIFGFIFLIRLIRRYPRLLYFIGSFINLLFAFMLFSLQKISGVTQYSNSQWIILGLIAVLGLASLSFGIFYHRINIDKFKKLYGATIMSSILLTASVIPFKIRSEQDEKATVLAQIIFVSLAVFTFIYLGFFAKPKEKKLSTVIIGTDSEENNKKRHYH